MRPFDCVIRIGRFSRGGADLFQVTEYMHSYLEFEKPVADIEGRIQELLALVEEDGESHQCRQ